jgi:hypothetical protein
MIQALECVGLILQTGRRDMRGPALMLMLVCWADLRS